MKWNEDLHKRPHGGFQLAARSNTLNRATRCDADATCTYQPVPLVKRDRAERAGPRDAGLVEEDRVLQDSIDIPDPDFNGNRDRSARAGFVHHAHHASSVMHRS